MKSLALDSTGDLLIEHHTLQMVDGNELIRQKVQEVINTNKGEWFFDWEQGVEFSNILGKNVTEEAVMMEISNALLQVDENLTMSDFSMTKSGRTLAVTFTAKNETTETELTVSTEY